MKITKLAGDLAWPEGPSPLGDGGIAFVETYRSKCPFELRKKEYLSSLMSAGALMPVWSARMGVFTSRKMVV